MTEQEWLNAESVWLLGEYLRTHKKVTRTKVGRRRLQLFNCASLRELFWGQLGENGRRLLEAFERFSNGETDKDEMDKARAKDVTASDGHMMIHYAMGDYAHGIYGYIRSLHLYERLSATTARHQCDLLRHIFGNPFRPYPIPDSWPSTVTHLADAFYNGQDCAFALHDALLDAGHAELADHFCQETTHPKGCWALDLILGKE